MKKVYITKPMLNQSKYYNPRSHNESILFIHDNDLLKLLKKEYRSREETIEKLSHINHQNLVTPKYGLYDRKNFIGYGMNYYKDYVTLEKILCDESISFDERKKLALIICQILIDLENEKFAFYDLHSNNIIYNSGDIKLVDLDSGVFSNDTNYSSYLKYSHTRLARLALAILYATTVPKIEQSLQENSSIIKKLPSNIRKLYRYVSSNQSFYFPCLEYIENIDENIVEDTKIILKKD